MQDEAAIANMAAVLLGADNRLIDLEEDSVMARSFKESWASVRLATLRAHPWNFAMKRWSLPSRVLAGDETIHPWLYAFPMPPECLRLHEIVSPVFSAGQWSLEGQDILAMETGPLIIRGVRDVPETGLWDVLFEAAFAAHLAYWNADRITGDRARRDDCSAAYAIALRNARSTDGRENPPIPASYEGSSWVTARYGA